MHIFNTVAIYVFITGTIILTVMGAIPATRSLGWRIAIILVGFFSVSGGIYSAYVQQQEARGADFFYFVPVVASTTSFRLMALNPSALPIYDAYLYIRNAEASEPLPKSIEIGTIPPGTKDVNLNLPFGYYQIGIRARYDTHKYIEMIKVTPFRGQVGQSYSISELGKAGPMISKYTHPDEFPETYPTESTAPEQPSDYGSRPNPHYWSRPREWLRSIFVR